MAEPAPAGSNVEKLSEAEHVKAASRYLRGTITTSLSDPLTGAVAEGDAQLLKFHGTYQQDDRDLRNERARQKLEPAYEFMVRIRVPGGVVTPQQWLALDRLARQNANGSLRLTTRQSFQLHGVLKWNLKATIRAVYEAGLTTLAACGDVNRNVMCSPNPEPSDIHGEVYECAQQLAQRLSPRTTAYGEIWLDESASAAGGADHEPLYGPTYLPRKFKVGIAVPPSNDVDVLSQDLGLIAIAKDGRLCGFNVAVGGGLAMTHGEPSTYPNLAWVIGYCRTEQLLEVAEKVLLVQRDFGDRTNRRHARLKYTIDDRGVPWFQAELHRRLGWQLEGARPYRFEYRDDRYGWVRVADSKWHLTLRIENGRIRDWDGYPLMSGLRSIAECHEGQLRLTANQNLIVANVSSAQRPRIEELVKQYQRAGSRPDSALRRNAMACVALPTCGLAMAESERYMPELMGKLEQIAAEAGLRDDAIVVRMTGCPNGCARPYLAEIGLVGKAVGKYNLYLGADFVGQRLGRLYRENIDEAEILETLRPIFFHYAKDRQEGERFGDFVVRTNYVRTVAAGRDFHAGEKRD